MAKLDWDALGAAAYGASTKVLAAYFGPELAASAPPWAKVEGTARASSLAIAGAVIDEYARQTSCNGSRKSVRRVYTLASGELLIIPEHVLLHFVRPSATDGETARDRAADLRTMATMIEGTEQ